jgi:hypothetical protein
MFINTVGIRMGTNCALLTNLFIYALKADLVQGLLEKNEKKQSQSFIFDSEVSLLPAILYKENRDRNYEF